MSYYGRSAGGYNPPNSYYGYHQYSSHPRNDYKDYYRSHNKPFYEDTFWSGDYSEQNRNAQCYSIGFHCRNRNRLTPYDCNRNQNRRRRNKSRNQVQKISVSSAISQNTHNRTATTDNQNKSRLRVLEPCDINAKADREEALQASKRNHPVPEIQFPINATDVGPYEIGNILGIPTGGFEESKENVSTQESAKKPMVLEPFKSTNNVKVKLEENRSVPSIEGPDEVTSVKPPHSTTNINNVHNEVSKESKEGLPVSTTSVGPSNRISNINGASNEILKEPEENLPAATIECPTETTNVVPPESSGDMSDESVVILEAVPKCVEGEIISVHSSVTSILPEDDEDFELFRERLELIQQAKATREYRKYLDDVPKEKRTATHPRTPHHGSSNQRWKEDIYKPWRKFLQKYH